MVQIKQDRKKHINNILKPEYGRCIDIVTKEALREMTMLGLFSVVIPLLTGFFPGPEALAGLLRGPIVVRFMLTLLMDNGGGAWEKRICKKLIEDGNYGGKGSEARKAAMVGDTVGDPFKDIAGQLLMP